MDPYLHEHISVVLADLARTMQELPFTVAVDFDGVIHDGLYPDIGKLAPDCREVMRRLQARGAVFILSTCRTGKLLEDARQFCTVNSLPFAHYNENLASRINAFGGDSRKISADVYIDDKNVPGGFPGWLEVESEIMAKLAEKE